jgi:hypothetical protein
MDVSVTVPDVPLDGAVVEMYRDSDGHFAALVRIPAPADDH